MNIQPYIKNFEKNFQQKKIVDFKKFIFFFDQDSKFIVNLHRAFNDFNNLYLVLDYEGGGDLRYHMAIKYFDEK